MAESVPSLNALSCRMCKIKKVRCNRITPNCDRCRTQGIECSYPERVKRKSRKGFAARLTVTNSPLSTILQRLERVEEHVISLNPLPTSSDDSPGAPRPGGRHTRSSAVAHEAACSEGSAASSPASQASPSILSVCTNTPLTSSSTHPLVDVDITAVLMEAVGQVQRLKLRDIAKSTLAAGISIPTQLAKDWVDNYVTHMRADAFLSLIDPKLIRQIPDIIDSPFVYLDAAIVVIYFCVLYQGCSLPSSLATYPHHIKYARQVYLCCLRSLPNWQREATGTTTDFIAATMTAQVSAEHFDYDFSWQLFKQACEYAHGLNMHNLDSGDGLSSSIGSKVDSDRRGFWELIQVELFFRLMHNKSPTFTESMNSWRVNLPYLSPDSQPDIETIPTLAFLVSSRITFVLTRFFQLLEENAPAVDILPKIELLGGEIEALFDEWQMDEWIQRAEENDIHWWMLTDVVLTGYTCVIFMLRKYNILDSTSPSPISSDSDIPRSPLAIRTSRHMLGIIYRLLVKVPHSETMSLIVGFFQAFIPYACLASNVVHSPNPSDLVSDLELLEGIAKKITDLSQEEQDFTPLVRALQGVNSELRRWVEQDSSAGG